MRVFLFLIASIIFSKITAQNWEVTSGKSDFDGKYIAASVSGSSNTSSYRKPLLVINKYNDDDINFYITDFGYAGCSNTEIKIAFDGDKMYCANFEISRDSKAVMFNSFKYYRNDLDWCGIVEYSIYNILKQVKTAKRLTVRIENDCFKSDFSFDLLGSSVVLEKVLGKGFIENQLCEEQAELNNFKNSDSIYQYLEIGRPELRVDEDLFKRMEFLYKIEKNNLRKYYNISIDDLGFLYSLCNSFSLSRDSRFSVLENQIFCARNWNPNEDNFLDSVVIVPTNYYVNVENDSLSAIFTPSQRLIEDYISANSKYSDLSALRLIEIESFESVRINLSIKENKELCELVELDVMNYYIKPTSINAVNGEFVELNKFNGNKRVVKVIPYLYEKSDQRSLRLKLEELRNLELFDSIKKWNEQPDPGMRVYAWYEISDRPTLDGCFPAEYCVKDYVKVGVINLGSKKLKRSLQDLIVTVEIDYYGKIKLISVDSLDVKLLPEIDRIISSLKPLTSPRINGKFCRVNLSMRLSDLL